MQLLKAQSSMEFFILVGLAFITVILFVGLAVNELKEFRETKEFLLIKDLALKLQKEIVIAANVENGYERSFNLPEELDSVVDYFITTTNVSLSINSSRALVIVPISNVTGDFTKGDNKIEKINGKVYVNR